MSKHTPSPWFRKPGANDAGAIHGEEGRGVASVHYQEDSECYEANARLIAAAPDLFEALKEILEHVESPDITRFPENQCTLCHHYRMKGHRAIAKAEEDH